MEGWAYICHCDEFVEEGGLGAAESEMDLLATGIEP